MLESILNFFNPSTSQGAEHFALLGIIGAALFFIYLERRKPYTPGLKLFRQGFWLDFFWYTLFQSFYLKILIFDWVLYPLDQQYEIFQAGLLSHWPMWALVVFFLFTHDFYIYWFHRAQHNSKFLWRIHEAHHSCKEVDWVAGSRSHALEIIINQTIEFAPIILLLDAQTAAVMIPLKGMIDAIWGQYIHSNINVKHPGVLRYIINGPEMHQWHHAESETIYFKNYATKFAFWDWLFGTAYLPDFKPRDYGLPYHYPMNYFLQTLYSLWRFDVQQIERIPWVQAFDNAWSRLFAPLLPPKPVAAEPSQVGALRSAAELDPPAQPSPQTPA